MEFTIYLALITVAAGTDFCDDARSLGDDSFKVRQVAQDRLTDSLTKRHDRNRLQLLDLAASHCPDPEQAFRCREIVKVYLKHYCPETPKPKLSKLYPRLDSLPDDQLRNYYLGEFVYPRYEAGMIDVDKLYRSSSKSMAEDLISQHFLSKEEVVTLLDRMVLNEIWEYIRCTPITRYVSLWRIFQN